MIFDNIFVTNKYDKDFTLSNMINTFVLLYLNSDRDFDITIMATLLLIEIIQGLYYYVCKTSCQPYFTL